MLKANLKLVLLTALTMLAFAANSLLNRAALAEGAIGPGEFALLRVASGALVLVLLMSWRARRLPMPLKPKLASIAGLTAYLAGFSYAYVSMDAGLGALVLFGGVQLTMFIGALSEGERPARRRWYGMLLAMVGLAILSWPDNSPAMQPIALSLMGLAALGWGVYSLQGRSVNDPLLATGWNFLYSCPLVLAVVLCWPSEQSITTSGALLAIVSGGITSAIGYALWYSLLPALGAIRAAVVQLSVPVIALTLGSLWLGEQPALVTLCAAVMILGGIAIGLLPGKQHGETV